jgi:hypothetical protein
MIVLVKTMQLLEAEIVYWGLERFSGWPALVEASSASMVMPNFTIGWGPVKGMEVMV